MKVFALSRVLPCVLPGVLAIAAASSFAAKPCDELKTEIATKLDAAHVTGYALEIVATDQVGERKVVGSCDGGSKKIVYVKPAK
jgi:hypothetical protein